MSRYAQIDLIRALLTIGGTQKLFGCLFAQLFGCLERASDDVQQGRHQWKTGSDG
jgi:hypothetical protein